MLAAAALASLANCTRPDPCADLGAHQAIVATLLFGGPVSAAEWASFVEDTVTPRFPDGLTTLEGSGQWRDPASGRLALGPSRVLLIAAAPTNSTGRALSQIADAYKVRFRQKSVGVLTAPACAAF